MAGMPDPNAPQAQPQKGFWQGVVDTVMPNPPTWDSVKQTAKGMLTAPDPYQAAGDMVNAYRKGDYMGAMEAGLNMPGIPQQGTFYNMKSPGFNKDQFRGAMELQAAGAGPREIQAKTLMHQDPTGQWLQEGTDHMAHFNSAALPPGKTVGDYYAEVKKYHPQLNKEEALIAAQFSHQLAIPKSVPLESIYSHPDFFEKMPSAHGMPLIRETNFGQLGSFNPSIMRFSVAAPGKKHDPLLTMLHEGQHYVDDHSGVLQSGGNPGLFAKEPWAGYMLPGETPKQAYLRLSGEQRANAVEARAGLDLKQRALRHPTEDMIPFDQQITRR